MYEEGSKDMDDWMAALYTFNTKKDAALNYKNPWMKYDKTKVPRLHDCPMNLLKN